jgi:cytochrome c peroxidase
MNTHGIVLVACAAIVSGCVDPDPGAAPDTIVDTALVPDPNLEPSLAISRSAQHARSSPFETALPGSNGRSCATCHPIGAHTALSIADADARFAANPRDPLFHPLDADDPSAATPTYAHVRKGLIRVVLPLPANMDVIDLAGNVVTPASRQIEVWRGVPTVENTAITGPYQLDGRAASLEAQAQAAITSHSQGPTVSSHTLDRIAGFQRAQFSSARAAFVAAMLAIGVPRDRIPVPERAMRLSRQERRGRDVFELACTQCHGGATGTQIINRSVHDGLFFALGSDGNIIYDAVPGQEPTPRLVPHASEFLNIGIGLLSGYGQMGLLPMFNDDIQLPRYRFRFYTDATRRQQVTDLPPVPVTASGDPNDLNPALNELGAPITGPSLNVQTFSTDPGRAAITGDPLDFEAFDVPQLRGIAHTAPYFHDNNSGTLRDVVDLYSRFILQFPPIGLPPVNPPEQPEFPPESLTVAQKQDLLAFLERL